MAGEPVQYSAYDQFLDFQEANYIVAARVDRLITTAQPTSSKTRDSLGPAREVIVDLQIVHHFRGDIEVTQLQWRYLLQFGIDTTLSEGDEAVFFLRLDTGDGEPASVNASYLLEDSIVSLPRWPEMDEYALVVVDVDGGRIQGSFWAADSPDSELEELVENLSLTDTGNHLILFGRDPRGWRVLESVTVKQKWPF